MHPKSAHIYTYEIFAGWVKEGGPGDLGGPDQLFSHVFLISSISTSCDIPQSFASCSPALPLFRVNPSSAPPLFCWITGRLLQRYEVDTEEFTRWRYLLFSEILSEALTVSLLYLNNCHHGGYVKFKTSKTPRTLTRRMYF